MDLIYYLPLRNDAPANVGRSILKHIDLDKTPFDNLFIFIETKKNQVNYLKSFNYRVINLLELLSFHKECMVHIPISPNVFPNKKMVLHIFSLLTRKPLIFNFHGNIHAHVVSEFMNRKKIEFFLLPSFLLMPFFLRKCSAVITHSYILGDFLKDKYNLKNVTVIPNGIDDYWFSPIDGNISDKCNQLNEKKFNIFYHGRLSHEKGIDLLINALALYLNTNGNAFLHVAGEGDCKSSLQQLSVDLNISKNVVFLGNINSEDIKYYLKNVDIAVYPSRFDNFPLAMLEAIACAECPVVLSFNSGICDFIKADGYNLKMIPPTTDSILQSLFEVTNMRDLIPLQKQFAESYRWNNIIIQYLDLYSNIFAQQKLKMNKK